MPRLGVSGVNSSGGGPLSKSHLQQHQPPLFTSDLKLETVNLFLRKVEHSVSQGGTAMGTTESDPDIDSAWLFMDPEVYSWFTHNIHQQGVMIVPAANSIHGPVTWPHFESAIHHQFVSEVAITAVRREIRTLRHSMEMLCISICNSPNSSAYCTMTQLSHMRIPSQTSTSPSYHWESQIRS
jgi:hypothetical protein